MKLRATVVLLLLVWGYARFGDWRPSPPPPQIVVGSFAHSEPFTATPGAGFEYVNARTGPGTEYPVLQRFDRGTLLSGIARRLDRDGAYWIELEGGGSYVKETVLVPAPEPSGI